jgi:putative ABC transport system substrate-binding protein
MRLIGLAVIFALGHPSPTARALQQALRDRGYVEGQNLFIEYRYAEGSQERLQQMATDLVRLPVDLIVAWNAPGTRAAQHATRTIPIVMMNTPDPVEEGFVASLARPGGNTTGFSAMRTELVGKQLELLKETVPQSSRIAVLANPAQPAYKLLLHQLTVTAPKFGLQLHAVELRRGEELNTAFAAMTQAGANALIVLAEPRLINPQRRRIVDLAAKSRLPAIYNWRTDTDAGGLMSYGPS